MIFCTRTWLAQFQRLDVGRRIVPFFQQYGRGEEYQSEQILFVSTMFVSTVSKHARAVFVSLIDFNITRRAKAMIIGKFLSAALLAGLVLGLPVLSSPAAAENQRKRHV